MNPREVLRKGPGWAAVKGMQHGAALWDEPGRMPLYPRLWKLSRIVC